MKTFGSRLQELRQNRGISRRDLAARVQLSPAYLEKVERGYSAPPAAAAISDICKALKANTDELFALSDKLPPDLIHALQERPLLLQLVRVAQAWSQLELREYLAGQGVTLERIEACDIERQCPKNDERRAQREVVTADLRRAVFYKDNYECVYCSSQTLLEVDHIQPVSVGGTNDIENLVACCSKCNKRKGNRDTPFVMVFGRFRIE